MKCEKCPARKTCSFPNLRDNPSPNKQCCLGEWSKVCKKTEGECIDIELCKLLEGAVDAVAIEEEV